jgi:hypothetical protein
MNAVVPGVVDVNLTAGGVIANAEHGMPGKLDEHGPSGVDFGLELGVGESGGRVAGRLSFNILREIAVGLQGIASLLIKQLQAMGSVAP